MQLLYYISYCIANSLANAHTLLEINPWCFNQSNFVICLNISGGKKPYCLFIEIRILNQLGLVGWTLQY